MLEIDKYHAHPTHIVIGDESQLILPCNKHSILYISPEKSYLLGDIDIIFEKTKFTLDDHSSFFFVLKNAERLTTVCANKLLKLLEEPPRGYFFILLTQNENAILPTIRSRSYIHRLSGKQKNNIHQLAKLLLDKSRSKSFFEFEQELKNPISESETVDIINELLITIDDDEQRIFLEKSLRRPPQPGSTNLFWKKLFLTFPR